MSHWPREAREVFLAYFGEPQAAQERRLARAFDVWLSACAAEKADPSEVSHADWLRRSRHLNRDDRNAMRAVLGRIYRAEEELYPRREPKRGRSARDRLAADITRALARWPEAWRTRAEPLLAVDEDPVFDGRLVAAWSPTTLVVTARSLAGLFDAARSLGLDPDINRSVVRAFLAQAQQRAAAGEIRVASVAVVLRCAASIAPIVFPERDWTWLREAERGMKRLAEKAPSRNAARAMPAPELYLAGRALLAEAASRLQTARGRRDRTKAFRLARAGFATVLLITTPVRASALGLLRVGEHLDAEQRRLKLDAFETKERRADERELPHEVYEMLRLYMTFRAEIAARSETTLFVSERSGGPITSRALSRDIVSALKSLLGQPVNPHAFRHSAASYIVSEAPAEADLASTILNHSSPTITRRYRAAAHQIVAGKRLWQAYKDSVPHESRAVKKT